MFEILLYLFIANNVMHLLKPTDYIMVITLGGP